VAWHTGHTTLVKRGGPRMSGSAMVRTSAMDDNRQRATPMIRTPGRYGRRIWRGAAVGVCAAAVLDMAGCGQQPQQSPTAVPSSGVPAGQAGVVRGLYTWAIAVDGQRVRLEFEVLADGDRRARFNWLRGPEPGSDASATGGWIVWDGRVLLTYDHGSDPVDSRTENPEAGQLPIYVLVEGSPYFTRACPNARRLGTHSVLGRTAVRYACAASTEEGGLPEKHEMSIGTPG
jgi:hypothetical protein